MPLNPTSTRALLNELEHLPNKKLGQNFLVDGNIVRKSVDLAGLEPGAAVVEIGPGLGTLTRALLEAEAEVWAVERDATLAIHLRGQLAIDQPRLHLTEGDCLDEPLAGLPEKRAKAGYRIVANLPYAVSTPWMDAVLSGPLPERMVLMLQKEAGDRYAAESGRKTFGAISIFLQSAYSIEGRHAVAAQCFHPAPKVDSVLLRLDRRKDAVLFSPVASAAIRRVFTQRRKQLRSLCKRDPQPELLRWFDSLAAEGVAPTIRPEDLRLEYWQRLTKFLHA